MPANNTLAGIASSGSITSKFVNNVVVSTGLITVTFKGSLDPSVSNSTITFNPTMGQNAAVSWSCTGGNVIDKYRPANCRG
jgi:type IV pilus assembly protein PilA